MTYAIIGFGNVGQALATMFARKGLDVTVASRRGPDALADKAKAIGPGVSPKPLEEALKADTVLLAVPYSEVAALAGATDWTGKTVIDVTNAFGVPVETLDGLTSSAASARALKGSRLVKAFNHLPAATLAADPAVNGGRRVIFVSSDDAEAAGPVRALAEQLGFAPVWLGPLAGGGALVQAQGRDWKELIFQDFVKFDGG